MKKIEKTLDFKLALTCKIEKNMRGDFMEFVYTVPTKVYFGDKLDCLGAELARFGKRVLLTYGGGSIKQSGLYDRVITQIDQAGLERYELSGIAPNPRIESVRKGARLCKEQKIDVILAVGGGSTLDAAKYMAAGAKADFDPWKFFSDWAPIKDALPVVTVLTLSATGSEMDGGGVITNPETNEKIGRMEDILRPRVSFLDPALTCSVSRYQTACGSADILSHIMETYFTVTPDLYMLDAVMEGLMRTVVNFAPKALKNPDDMQARSELMWASSWAINGFITGAKRHAWSVHPMEHELSAFYDITHGLGLAILTPRWLRYCLNEKTLPRYLSFGVNVFGISPDLPPLEIAEKAIDALSEFLFGTLGLDGTLTAIGIGEEHIPEMAKKAVGGGTLAGFIPLTAEDAEKIYRMCL